MNKNLVSYIETNIMPQYAQNDSGHGIEHINYVIERCFKFAEQFKDIDFNMLYVAAAFHDVAHHIDKNRHEILSAQIFYDNEDMRIFFSDDERAVIKEAIEDHRASANKIPRNVYGAILSSADRSTDLNDFLKRTHAYTLKHLPNSTVDEMLARAYEHTRQKYGSNGYAKHYVEDEDYNKFRKEISVLLNDKDKFDELYMELNIL